MKKFLSLFLAIIMVFSCLSIIPAAALDEEDEKEIAEAKQVVAKVISPITTNTDTAFAKSINTIGYTFADKAGVGASMENFNSFLRANANDSMFGITLDYLYNNGTDPFIWSDLAMPLVVDTTRHNTEVANNSTNKEGICEAKEMYDACAEILLGNRIEYDTKKADAALFEKIVENDKVIYNSKTGREEYHYNYFFEIKKSEMSLVRANINLYLKRIASNYLGGGRFYTKENIVLLSNFIGKMLNPSYAVLADDYDPIGDNLTLDAYEFFGKVVELSGLGELLQINWCNQGEFDFIPLIAALGVRVDNLFTNEKTDGYYLGRRILTDAFSEFVSAPLAYILGLISNFSKHYSLYYEQPIKALFAMRISQGPDGVNGFSHEDLTTYTGVMNFFSWVADQVLNELNGKEGSAALKFVQMPVRRFGMAADHDELFVYLLCYLDINRVYSTNPTVLNNILNIFKTAAKGKLTKAEISTVEKFYKAFVQGDLTVSSFMLDFLNLVTTENVSKFEKDFFSALKVSISNMFKRFIDAIDSIMRFLLGQDSIFDRI